MLKRDISLPRDLVGVGFGDTWGGFRTLAPSVKCSTATPTHLIVLEKTEAFRHDIISKIKKIIILNQKMGELNCIIPDHVHHHKQWSACHLGHLYQQEMAMPLAFLLSAGQSGRHTYNTNVKPQAISVKQCI